MKRQATPRGLTRRSLLVRLGGAGLLAMGPPVLLAGVSRAGQVNGGGSGLLVYNAPFEGPRGLTNGVAAVLADAPGAVPLIMIVHGEAGPTPAVGAILRRVALSGAIAFAPYLTDIAPPGFAAGRPGGSLETVLAGVDYLQAQPAGNGQVGAIGLGSGGLLVGRAATTGRVLAGVSFDAVPSPDVAVAINVPMMLHVAERERATADAFAEGRVAAGVEAVVHAYSKVEPGFWAAAGAEASMAATDAASGDQFSLQAVNEALDRSIEFLIGRLGFG